MCCHPKLVSRLETMMAKDVVVPLRSREVISTGGGATLRTLFTPGHEVDHVCSYLEGDRVLFTGDTILGASSSTVRDLASTMKSLQLLSRHKHVSRYEHDIICSAHGPVVSPPRGARLVRWYVNHREQREQQILAALERGVSGVKEIARHVYPRNFRGGLRPAAESNVTTHLEKLKQEGRVVETPSRFALR